jgi:hypothetical protein
MQGQCKNTKKSAKTCLSQITPKQKKMLQIEELERKNNGSGQAMTPRSRSNGFPSLREKFVWWGLLDLLFQTPKKMQES